ncbi:GNAT family N-acetyltransferase [Corallococcus sp. c25j21]|nr:GNAT family N-acetyltransferase [Corallococcus silvisoli]
MGPMLTEPRFTYLRLTQADLPMLAEWLARPHVAEWWGAPPTLDELRQDLEVDIAADVSWQYIARLDGRPVGFIQAYDVMRADPDWWREETDPGARGIDQFLAHAEQLGQGLGTRLVGQFIAKLFEDPAVTKVQTDPSLDNARAIRAYEKAGFQPVARVVTPDGPALLMVVRRDAWRGP